MKIAIVGTSINLTENEERDARQLIAGLIKGEPESYSNPELITVISGGAKGIDTLAVEVAKGLGCKTLVFNPKRPEWKYYSKRNLEIAEKCDKLFCISVPNRNKSTLCYFHHKDAFNDTNPDKIQKHEKTAGCWTMQKAKELGKQCFLYVTVNRL